jgi:hypothetical protein
MDFLQTMVGDRIGVSADSSVREVGKICLPISKPDGEGSGYYVALPPIA